MHASIARAVRSAAVPLACLLALPAQADIVNLSGTLFDVSYDNSSFIYQTGTVPDPGSGSPVPFYEQLGGFSIVAPDTVRYSLRPKEVFGDPATIVPGGAISVGGSALSTDTAADAAVFTLLPKGGNQALSVQMLTVGSFDNSGTESATLTYAESLSAAGAADGLALSLGVFSSGALPSGSLAAFTALAAPFNVDFGFALAGTSSAFDFTSSAAISHVDFKVVLLPVPEPSSAWLLALGLLGAATRARRRA